MHYLELILGGTYIAAAWAEYVTENIENRMMKSEDKKIYRIERMKQGFMVAIGSTYIFNSGAFLAF